MGLRNSGLNPKARQLNDNMAAISKQEADAYDRTIEAAAELAELIAPSGIVIGEYDLEDLTIYLAQNSLKIQKILAPIKKLGMKLMES